MVTGQPKYFICHHSQDAELAQEVDRLLRGLGFSTWLAPRDVRAGHLWATEIIRGIMESDVLLLVGTELAYASEHVVREVDLAVQEKRELLPLLVDGAPGDPLRYYVATTQCLMSSRQDAMNHLRSHLRPAQERAWRYSFLDRETVDVDGHRLTFRRWGDSRGTPVILFHGLGFNADDWDEQAQVTAMEGRSAYFLAPDFPGHYTSWKGIPSSLQELGPLFAGMISKLGIDAYGIIGHSLGGLVALHLASRDSRAAWCVAGGVTEDSWNGGDRERVAAAIRRGDSSDETVRFLQSRDLDLEYAIRILEYSLPEAAALSRVRQSARLLTTDDDAVGCQALAKSMGLEAPGRIEGTHASSFFGGGFLKAALDLTLPHSRPASTRSAAVRTIIALSGLPAVGKSTVASELTGRFDATCLSSEGLRRRAFPTPTYTTDESQRVWEIMEMELERETEAGRDVILDATFALSNARSRLRRWLERADDKGYRTLAVWLDVEGDVGRQRHRLRSSSPMGVHKSDLSVLEVMRARSGPEWVGVRLDTTHLTPEGAAHLLEPLIAGDVTAFDAPVFLHAHAALAEAASRSSEASWPAHGPAWLETLLTHIDVDRGAGTFARWGRSTLVEQGAVSALVPEVTVEALASRAGLVGGVGDLNAGLAHAYCYLMSDAWTPYGFKRDRWLDGQLERALGVERGRLRPLPARGTLLGNLTDTLDAHLAGVSVPWIDTSGTRSLMLVEEDLDSGVRFESRIVQRDGCSHDALIYFVQTGDDLSTRRYLTVFPTTKEYTEFLELAVNDEGPLTPRYNALVPVPVSARPARRRLIPISQ